MPCAHVYCKDCIRSQYFSDNSKL
ncbi:hypothetical protein ACSAZL_09425 [Methanosarcina sp. T3]